MNIDSKRSRFGLFWKQLLGSAVLAGGVFLTSCQQPVNTVRPVYQGIYAPKAFQMTIGSRTSGTKVDFNIDHVHLRIYNETPLPFGTELDSVYLTVYLSNQIAMSLINEATGAQTWQPGDTSKISAKGGRLTLNVSREGHDPLVYDIRVMSYGYDPNKLTWENRGTEALPMAADQSKVYEIQGVRYYMGRTGDLTGLYRLDLNPLKFTPLTGAQIPQGLRPETILKSIDGKAWAVTDDGGVYYSLDQETWTAFYLPTEEEQVIALLNDNTKSGSKESSLSVITRIGEDYFFRSMRSNAEGSFETFSEMIPVPVTFPIAGGYVYTYNVSGTQHSSIFGGLTKDGLPSEKSYFTSDGLRWAETPYTSISKSVPELGGLYLADPDTPGRIILVGGVYDGTVSRTIKVSTDRGITWTELTEEQLPPAAFLPRSGASGLLVTDAEGIEHLFVIGGNISGVPSGEVWHGFLDTKGGVVNAYED